MKSPDLQRLAHIRDYCLEIEKTINRYGRSFDAFDQDADYQRSVSFSILQIGELSGGLSPGIPRQNRRPYSVGSDERNA